MAHRWYTFFRLRFLLQALHCRGCSPNPISRQPLLHSICSRKTRVRRSGGLGHLGGGGCATCARRRAGQGLRL